MKNEKTRWFGIPKLFPYLKGYGRLVLVDMVALGFIGSAMDAVIPLFQQYAIDHFIADKTMQGVGVFIALYLLAGRSLIYIFVDSPTGKAMDTGLMFLRIVSPFYVVISAKIIADGILRGVGMMRQFMVTTFTDLTLRVSLAVLLSASFGPRGIWSAWPIGWSTAAVLSLLFYLTGPWRRRGAVDKA